jgi:hypothetical protein
MAPLSLMPLTRVMPIPLGSSIEVYVPFGVVKTVHRARGIVIRANDLAIVVDTQSLR